MEVKQVSVVGVLDQLQSGRNKPYLVECESDDGSESVECVSKVHKSECGSGGLFRELYASLLALQLKVPVPEPFIVRVGFDIINAMPPLPMYQMLTESIGLNFGCEFLAQGYTTWARGKALTDRTAPDAMKIFMFDALTRNPDRRPDKPNVLTRSGEIIAIDHEMCFGFLRDFRQEPLVVKDELKSHLFFEDLKNWHNEPAVLPANEWADGLRGVTIDTFLEMRSCIPQIWLETEDEIDDSIERINNHLHFAQNCADEFVLQVKEALS